MLAMSEIVVGWRLAGVPKRTSRSDTGVQEGLRSFKGERMRCRSWVETEVGLTYGKLKQRMC
jgi:hypothetical protein